MELEEVKHMRTSGVKEEAKADAAVKRLDREQNEREAEGDAARRPQRRALPFITRYAHKPVQTGAMRQKTMGKKPARILKKVRQPDVAKAFGVEWRKKKRRRNMGAGLEFDEAKTHWVNWLVKHRRRHYPKVPFVESPKKEDVDAEYEDRVARRRERRPQREQRSPMPWVRDGE
eukprot:NODE_14810_length_1084_cov_4.480669.p1 GENE.NODE_14810_length_1084_cov_4.480669~~NODE_14810_length_1084_cov_4.480669.p1  ORF type:complete len:174 (+),score=39.35 NODE_14810_length_1084_cov_4.480669:492-1013(+)